MERRMRGSDRIGLEHHQPAQPWVGTPGTHQGGEPGGLHAGHRDRGPGGDQCEVVELGRVVDLQWVDDVDRRTQRDSEPWIEGEAVAIGDEDFDGEATGTGGGRSLGAQAISQVGDAANGSVMIRGLQQYHTTINASSTDCGATAWPAGGRWETSSLQGIALRRK